MKKTLLSTGVLAVALLGPTAQASASTHTSATTTQQSQSVVTKDDNNNDDNTGKWGLAGLLGALGLAGLAQAGSKVVERRNHTGTDRRN